MCAEEQTSCLNPAQRQFRGLDAAADDRPALQHQTAVAGFCQVGGRDQTVVPGAGNDNVESIALSGLLLESEGLTARGAIAAPFTKSAPRHFAHSALPLLCARAIRIARATRPLIANAVTTLSSAPLPRCCVPKSFSITVAAFRPGPSGDRASRIRRGAGLIQTGDRHAVLRPAGNRTQGAGLRRVLRSAVAGAVPVVRVHALQIERTLDDPRENLVVGQIGCEPPQVFQIRIGHLILDFVPVFRAFFQFVGLVADDLDGVHARGARVGSATELHTISSGGSSTLTA